MSESLHKNHRKRLRKELIEQSFDDNISDHKVMEALLFYGVPQKDTNNMAHELINKFGSIHGILEANPNDLFQVKGMTERAVTLIKLILPLSRRYHIDKYKGRYKFNSVDEIGDYIKKKHYGYREEVFMVTTFTGEGAKISTDIINKGDMTSVAMSIKSIVQCVLKHNAPYAVISHNHVGGTALPSREDLEMTRTLNHTLHQMNVRLLDHIIVAADDYVSLAQSKEYRSIFIIR